MSAFHTIAIPHEDILQGLLMLDGGEKKLWNGFLAGRDCVQEEVEKEYSQEKLF
jgi:hypothetical protein